MSKFTKGTWKACVDASVDVMDEQGKLTCTFCDIVGLHDKRERLANARLIANAPGMYELLLELAGLPSEQCMGGTLDISPLIHDARRLIGRVDNEEAEE